LSAPQTREAAHKQTWCKVKGAAVQARKGQECTEPCYEPCKEMVENYMSESERRPTKTLSQWMSAMGCLIRKSEWMKPHSNNQKPPPDCRP